MQSLSELAQQKIQAVPTNIVTGFLGVGKTTAIAHLLTQKPAQERWAVLVNEFGEVGIDGSLFRGEVTEEQGIFISEVPGGCMCCAAGLPMQVALNMLLKRARPDRLLIEPTGLGHPREVLQLLSSEQYRELLAINSTITLIDARKLTDQRYTENDIFNQQLDMADVIAANKADLYSVRDFLELVHYMGGRFREGYKPVVPLRNGVMDIELLKRPSEALAKLLPIEEEEHQSLEQPAPVEELNFGSSGFATIENQGDGFFSQGWVFKPDFVFDRERLNSLLLGIEADRAKGVFITKQGVVGFNKVDNTLTEVFLDDCMDSRIEVIVGDPSRLSGLEQKLLSCVQ